MKGHGHRSQGPPRPIPRLFTSPGALRRRWSTFIMSLRIKLFASIGLLVVGVAAMLLIMERTMTSTVEDSDYATVIVLKDLVADVLPPPAYVMEPMLIVAQLPGASDGQRAHDIERLDALE